jgi:hypothetical protein
MINTMVSDGKTLKSSKIEIYSWPSRPYGQLQGLGSNVFFITFRLDSILNKQKIIKKIGFLVKMANIVSFRPNHKIFNGFVGSGKKKKKSIQKFLEKIKFNENHG